VRLPSGFSASIGLFVGSLLFIWASGCSKSNSLVIYTSVDRDYAEPIITTFQKQHPDRTVKFIADSELTKTTGLYNRIQAEKKNPQADVFWNSEILRTVQLKQVGLLEPYLSPAAKDIPDVYKDPQGYWTGFSVRARVMIINTQRVPQSETPCSFPDLNNMKYRALIGMANPEFGTTSDHMVALYQNWGVTRFKLFFGLVKQNGLKILPGNASVRDAVAAGTLAYGLTDTDDAYAAIDEKKPVRMAFLDQATDGTLIIPNTVALLKGSPSPANGKLFIDYLLSPEVEEQLAKSRAKQIPVRPSVERPQGVPDLASIKALKVNYEELAKNLEPCLELIRILLP